VSSLIRSSALPIALGAATGVSIRLWFAIGDASGLLSYAFLFGSPLALGVVAGLARPTAASGAPPAASIPSYRAAIGRALAASALALGVCIALAIEGSICLAMASPLYFSAAALGAALAVFWRRNFDGGGAAPVFAAVLLPVVGAPLEALMPPPRLDETVANVREVDAPPSAVWREVRSVPMIDGAELPWSLAHLIGLPRPLEATLDREGIGAVRIARFERGLSFHERVDAWDPERAIHFAIRPDATPEAALDEHVTVGTPAFDVLEGGYVLEPIDDGRRTRVTLSSRHALALPVNTYARLWTRFVMWDLQRVILEVVARRAERAALDATPRP
jgi:hypothetical protein